MNEDKREEIEAFLRGPVPVFATYEAWKEQCRSFGIEAVEVAIAFLKDGSKEGLIQENALLSLRALGHEAVDNGEYGKPGFAYLVRIKGSEEWQEIQPRLVPEDYFETLMELIDSEA